MAKRSFEDFETNVDQLIKSQQSKNVAPPKNKLERRRRIEDINEEKRLREELLDY